MAFNAREFYLEEIEMKYIKRLDPYIKEVEINKKFREKISCCDCGLVHWLDIEIIKGKNILRVTFIFDDITYENDVREGVKLLAENGVRSRKLSFYVLYGFSDDDHIIERMKILADLNVDVYPMAYRGPDGKEPQRRAIYHEDILWHGPYRNKLKFLRLVGRLPK